MTSWMLRRWVNSPSQRRGQSIFKELPRKPLPRLSENPYARASLLTISRVMAAWTNASLVEHSRS
jgi:hypothetical protein